MGSRRWLQLVVSVLLVMPVVLAAAPADAALSVSARATFASPTVPGQAAPAELEVVNTTDPDAFAELTITDVRLIPSCGSSTPGCPVPDPDVFRLNGPFVTTRARTGAVCPESWTVALVDPTTGELRFTPNGPPARLTFNGGACFIGFTTTTLKLPTVDADPAPGLQTASIATAGALVGGSVGGGSGASMATVGEAPRSRFTALTPVRLLDTRPVMLGSLPGGFLELQVAGVGGVPANAAAAVLNVTAVEAAAPSYMTIWPNGALKPAVSNLNYGPGQTVPNLVTVGIGVGGKIRFSNDSGTVALIVDVAGYYAEAGESAFNALQPARLLDTRSGNGAPAAAVGVGGVVELQVTGRGDVSAGATGVVLNVTAVGLTGSPSSWVTAWPTGSPLPLASNLNLVAGQVVANLVVAKIGAGGKVSLRNQSGQLHLLADVAGYFGPTGATFTPVFPDRLLDTRFGTGAPPLWVPAGGTVELQVTGRAGVLPGPAAAVLNVTAVNMTGAAASWLTAWPTGELKPLASNVNMVAGQVVPNLVTVRLGTGGKGSISNAAGSVDILADVAGSFTA